MLILLADAVYLLIAHKLSQLKLHFPTMATVLLQSGHVARLHKANSVRHTAEIVFYNRFFQCRAKG